MIHNPPYALDKTFIVERQFDSVLKSTYSRLDALETRLRKSIANSLQRFSLDPTDAIQWRAESIINDQVSLSLLTEIRMMINQSENLEAVRENFGKIIDRYKGHVLSWASMGENSSSAMSNIASRITLEATAKMFGGWGFANEIERAIDDDIEETKKRVVVAEFVDLQVDEFFRLSPDTSTQLYRKLSPRKAIEAVWPISEANKQAVETRATVYIFRVPLDSDTLYDAQLHTTVSARQ